MKNPLALTEQQLLAECEVTRTRRGGPGGQHRNKVDSAIVLVHRTGIQAEANERRSQHENKRVAIERLRINLALAIRTECDSNTPPSSLWQERCTKGRIQVSSNHWDFATLLAEALDALETFDYELKAVANYLACSSSQFVKFLKQQPHAFAKINRMRAQRGLAKLK